MSKIEYGFRPSILFKKGRRNKTSANGSGSVIAIIGAFPCVSPDIQSFTDLDEAREALGVVAGKHDEEFYVGSNGELVKNNNYYYGAGALKQAFLDKTDLPGASEVIVCNISTYKYNNNGTIECEADGTTKKYNTTLKHGTEASNPLHDEYEAIDYDKLTVAFSKLKKEKFHNLVFAFPLDQTDGYVAPIVENGDDAIKALLRRYRTWTDDTYTIQHPIIGYFGYTKRPTKTVNNESTAVSVVDSIVDTNLSRLIDREYHNGLLELFDDERYYVHTLGALFAEGTYDENAGYILNPVESVAQYAGFVAGNNVDVSMTQKVIPTVKGTGLTIETSTNRYESIFEELNYDSDTTINVDGYKIIKAGGTMFECLNRTNKDYAVVTSVLPCGYDIAHIRTSAYVIEQIVLNPYLGKISNDTTIQAIDSVVTSIKNSMVERFPIIESIEHSVQKVSPTCVKIRVHINFYGIIINEVVYMSTSVENKERMVGQTKQR